MCVLFHSLESLQHTAKVINWVSPIKKKTKKKWWGDSQRQISVSPLPNDRLTHAQLFLPINRDLCGFLICPRQHAPLSQSVYPHEPTINGESPWCTPCAWVALTFRSCDDVSAFIYLFFLCRGRALNSAGSEVSLDGDKVCALNNIHDL